MDDVEGEDVNGEQGEGHGEQVEVPVVPLAHAVAHPRTVVVKSIWGGQTDGSCVNASNTFNDSLVLLRQFCWRSMGGFQ